MTDTNTAAELEGLAAKLADLDLSDGELDVLDQLLRRAASAVPEVEGFGASTETDTYSFRHIGKSGLVTDDGTIVLAHQLAVGIGLNPKGVWTDMRPLS